MLETGGEALQGVGTTFHTCFSNTCNAALTGFFFDKKYGTNTIIFSLHKHLTFSLLTEQDLMFLSKIS